MRTAARMAARARDRSRAPPSGRRPAGCPRARAGRPSRRAGALDIEAFRQERLLEGSAVRLGGDDDDGLVRDQPGAEIARHGLLEERLVLVELDGVVRSGWRRLQLG